jgi:hypothetical protein
MSCERNAKALSLLITQTNEYLYHTSFYHLNQCLICPQKQPVSLPIILQLNTWALTPDTVSIKQLQLFYQFLARAEITLGIIYTYQPSYGTYYMLFNSHFLSEGLDHFLLEIFSNFFPTCSATLLTSDQSTVLLDTIFNQSTAYTNIICKPDALVPTEKSLIKSLTTQLMPYPFTLFLLAKPYTLPQLHQHIANLMQLHTNLSAYIQSTVHDHHTHSDVNGNSSNFSDTLTTTNGQTYNHTLSGTETHQKNASTNTNANPKLKDNLPTTLGRTCSENTSHVTGTNEATTTTHTQQTAKGNTQNTSLTCTDTYLHIMDYSEKNLQADILLKDLSTEINTMRNLLSDTPFELTAYFLTSYFPIGTLGATFFTDLAIASPDILTTPFIQNFTSTYDQFTLLQAELYHLALPHFQASPQSPPFKAALPVNTLALGKVAFPPVLF